MAERGRRPTELWHEHDFGTGIRPGFDVRRLYAETTPYQQLEVFEHDYLGRMLILDGIVQTTTADEFIYHEMMVHVPLLGRPAAAEPASVLIIGGGDGGVLREVLRHECVRRVVMVEIDAAVVEACKKYIGIHGDYDDPRAELVIGDGFAYVKSPEVRAQPFDVAIVDSTDPIGPSQTLFTEEFVSDLAACLSPDGVMTRQAGVPFVQRDELPGAAAQVARIFGAAEVYRAAIPTYNGGDMAFVAGVKGGGTLRAPRRELRGRYYSPEVHTAAFALPAFWQELLAND